MWLIINFLTFVPVIQQCLLLDNSLSLYTLDLCICVIHFN